MKKLIFIIFLLVSSLAHSEITIIVPFSAGGTYDLLGRKLAIFMERELNEPVLVNNVLGAGGYIAVNKLDASNGKTILLTGSAFYANILENNLSVDKFSYVSVIAESPLFLGVTKASGITCEQLKNNDKQYFLGTSGIGSMSSKATSIVNSKYANIIEVPYKGSGQMTADILSGQISGTFYNSIPERPEIVLIANTSPKSVFGIPSMSDCFNISKTLKTQYLLIANKQMTPEFLQTVNTLAIKFTKDPDTLEHFKSQGMHPKATTLKSTTVSIFNEYNTWKAEGR